MKILKLILKIALFLVIGFVVLSLALAIFLPDGALDKYDDRLIYADKNDWTNLGLKDDVKTLITYEYRIVYQEDVDKENDALQSITTQKFNKIGFLTEVIIEENDLITSTKFKYKRKDKSQIDKEKYFMGDIQTMEAIWKYDKDGKGATKEFYTYKGPLFNVVKYEMDDNGNTTRKGYYTSSDSLQSEKLYKFDNEGNKIEYTSIPANGGTITRYIYEYEDGKLVKEYEYSTFDKISSYKYNNFGDIVEIIGDVEGFESNLTNYVFEYDEHNNWTQRNATYNEGQKGLMERKIIYYK